MGTRRVVVTRPAREAARWVDAFAARSIDAVALPLIAIEALDAAHMPEQAQALQAARQGIGGFDALMFVSAAAVEHYFGGRGASLRQGARCWATGPGTASALQAAGVPPGAIDMPPPSSAQFDSEHLWPVVRAQAVPGKRILLVRGGDAAGGVSGRDWLAREIEAAGAALEVVVAYRRAMPVWDESQRSLAQVAAGDGSIWVFTSTEGVRHLGALLPAARWDGARALATHPRIAQAATDAGFGVVHSSQPGLERVIASIESFA